MTQKEFVKNGLKQKSEYTRKALLTSNIFLYLGAIICLSSIICMILNLDRADSIILIGLSAVGLGVYMIILSLIILNANKKEKDNPQRSKYYNNWKRLHKPWPTSMNS